MDSGLWTVLLSVPLYAAIVGVVFWFDYGRRRRFEGVLRKVAERHGLALANAGLLRHASAAGTLGGDVQVVVDGQAVRRGRSSVQYTRVRASHPRLGTLLVVRPQGLVEELGKVVGLQDVEIGDPALDAAAVIRGASEPEVLARMTPEVREALTAAVAAGATFEDGTCTLRERGLHSDPERIGAIIALVAEVVRRLERAPVGPEALRARATEEPVPAVRRRAVRAALATNPPAEWVRGIAEGDDPVCVLLAARTLGEEGRDRLLWVLRGGGRQEREDAAVALAALPRDEHADEIEQVLIQGLEQATDPAPFARALGAFGSVRAVAALQALAERGLGLGAAADAARDAVRAIQSRAAGEAGGLALAEAQGGELAEAAPQARRPPQARVPER